ncbi:MAG: zf-HC2 domain-containing protein [Chloroflexi bacterium]|nr:zf-HC2 domain-containing protein [Chloroflexota bacterium]
MMTCRECQKQLIAYIHGELSPHQRRRLAYHLDDCRTCYGIYRRERDLDRELRLNMPLIGQGGLPKDRLWVSIQADLNRPRRRPALYQARYGLAVVMAALALLFPWVMGRQEMALAAPPTQPAPLLGMQSADATKPVPGGTAIALSVTANDNAPTPEARPRHAPAPDATAAP